MSKPLTFPDRTPEQKRALDERWKAADDELRASALAKRDERGIYNEAGSMPDYFVTPREILHEIRVCLMRTESILAAGGDALDTIEDGHNYFSFLGALLKIGWWQE